MADPIASQRPTSVHSDPLSLDGHPGVVLLSVALAEAERLGADGWRMIAAYAAGFEVWARLTALEEDKIHTKGWHPSATFGALAAAATAASLARLSPACASQTERFRRRTREPGGPAGRPVAGRAGAFLGRSCRRALFARLAAFESIQNPGDIVAVLNQYR